MLSNASCWISNASTFPFSPTNPQRNAVSCPRPAVASMQRSPKPTWFEINVWARPRVFNFGISVGIFLLILLLLVGGTPFFLCLEGINVSLAAEIEVICLNRINSSFERTGRGTADRACRKRRALIWGAGMGIPVIRIIVCFIFLRVRWLQLLLQI